MVLTRKICNFICYIPSFLLSPTLCCGTYKILAFFRPIFRKNELKHEKYAKNHPKMTFLLIFVFLCIKQKWPKIQFHLLGHIFVIIFAHFPIDLSDFCLEKFHLIYTLNQVRISDNPRKGVNLRA